MTTRTIAAHIQHTPPADGLALLPYQGFLSDTSGTADPGTVTGTIANAWEIRANTTYVDTRQEINVRLAPPLSGGSAAMHVVGQDFVNTAISLLEKARIRRFF